MYHSSIWPSSIEAVRSGRQQKALKWVEKGAWVLWCQQYWQMAFWARQSLVWCFLQFVLFINVEMFSWFWFMGLENMLSLYEKDHLSIAFGKTIPYTISANSRALFRVEVSAFVAPSNPNSLFVSSLSRTLANVTTKHFFGEESLYQNKILSSKVL